MIDITRRLIQALRLVPESSFITMAVWDCNIDGCLPESEQNDRLIEQLDNLLKYGEEHNRLYHDLIYKVEGLDCPPTESELERMDKLGKLVGLSSYENLNRIVRWTKFKNEQAKKQTGVPNDSI